jgi:hypothetical protein
MSCLVSRVADHALAALFFGEVEQQLGDAAVDVEQRQTLDVAIGFAQALHEALHDVQAEVEVLGQAALEVGLGDHQQFAGFGGDHVGRTRAAIDQPHFAEELAGAEQGQNHLASLFVAVEHLGAAADQHVERIGAVAGANDGGLARVTRR